MWCGLLGVEASNQCDLECMPAADMQSFRTSVEELLEEAAQWLLLTMRFASTSKARFKALQQKNL